MKKQVLFLSILLAISFTNAFSEKNKEAIKGEVIVAEVLFRTVGVGTIILGTAVFLVTSPITIFSGIAPAWNGLVVRPYHYTFTRPYGEDEY